MPYTTELGLQAWSQRMNITLSKRKNKNIILLCFQQETEAFMLKNKKLRMFLCILTALMVLFAFSGCVDNSSDQDEEDILTESGTKSGSGDMSLGLGNGDTYISRVDYTLLGDYYYLESYRVETEDGVMTELGLDMYLTCDEDGNYSDGDGVLAVYYDEDGNITSYEAYVGVEPVRATVSYKVGTNSSYYTCMCWSSDSIPTDLIWENCVTNSETGVTTYYTGTQSYYSTGATATVYEEQYTVSDDGILTLTQTTTKEYDEDGNVTTDETVEY